MKGKFWLILGSYASALIVVGFLGEDRADYSTQEGITLDAENFHLTTESTTVLEAIEFRNLVDYSADLASSGFSVEDLPHWEAKNDGLVDYGVTKEVFRKARDGL